METTDILLSTVGAEEPVMHIISIDGTTLNIAYELQNITLIGSSLQSVNSEYRMFNVNTKTLKSLFNKLQDSKGKLFYDIQKKIDTNIKNNSILFEKKELKRVTTHGIDLVIIYYLMCKHFKYKEAELINLNRFSLIIPLFKILDKIIGSIHADQLSDFINYIMFFNEHADNIGSKLLLINRYELENTNNLSYSIWKEIYIYKLIRSIPISTRNDYLCPMLDWAIIKYPSKQIFTNETLITKLNFGTNINYIRSTAKQQNKLSHDLIIGAMKQYELNEIKELTDKLVESTKDIDYALDDISMVMFFSNKQQSLYSAINNIVDASKETDITKINNPIKNILLDVEVMKQIVFQYMFSVLLLARQGIIHNDPHMNNILISIHKPSKLEHGLPNGKIISLGTSNISITLIDFDKAVLSHHHHNFFDVIANKMNEELAIVFDSVKLTIVDNYDQIFNCYAMYDIIRFALILRKLLIDMHENISSNTDITKHEVFIDNLIKMSTGILSKIYESDAKLPFNVTEPHSSVLWLIENIFKEYIKINKSKSSIDTIVRFIDTKSFVSDDTPEFVSSKRRYADKLKTHFISEYVTKNLTNLSM